MEFVVITSISAQIGNFFAPSKAGEVNCNTGNDLTTRKGRSLVGMKDEGGRQNEEREGQKGLRNPTADPRTQHSSFIPYPSLAAAEIDVAGRVLLDVPPLPAILIEAKVYAGVHGGQGV